MATFDTKLQTNLKKKYLCTMTYFKVTHTVLFMRAVDLIVGKKLAKTFVELIDDLAYSVKKTFYNWNKDKSIITNMYTFGPYYPEITKHPEKYVNPGADVRAVLAKLRAMGKIVFFVTNSQYDYMDCLMSYSYGLVFYQTAKSR